MTIKQLSGNIKLFKTRYKNDRSQKKVVTKNNNCNVFYTIKFYTLYLPSSIKDVRLYSRSTTKRTRDSKILIKQSYLMLVWLKYVTLSNENMNSIKDDVSPTSSAVVHNTKKVPSFFVYPCRLYKFTTIKSPMAHKTFSQEQFICKNYKLSISFTSKISDDNLTSLVHVNSSLYFVAFFFQQMPSISTNMLLVQRLTLRFFSRDTRFFSLFDFR